MLKLINTSSGYGGKDVVHNLSLTVQENQSLCVLGPNGCGKTTLLRIISGMLPYQGSVLLQGREVRQMKRKELGRKIAMMSQISQVYFSFTVWDTVLMGRYLHQNSSPFASPSKENKEFAEDCLEKVGIADIRNRQINTLSGGQLQRVFLARTFAQDPAILLLDEPTNHLDIKYQVELMEMLKEWCQKPGKAIVGVLHDINLALSLANRILLLQDGKAMALQDSENCDFSLLNQLYGADIRSFMLTSLERWKK